MRELFMHMLEASLYGSVVILAILLLRLVLKRAPKNAICFLWLLAGLRLVLPMEIESSFSLQPRLEPVAMNQSVEIRVPDFITASTTPAQEIDTEQPDTVKPDTDKTGREEAKTSADNWESTTFLYGVTDGKIRPLDYGDIGAWIWAAGILVLGTVSLVSYWKLKKQVREAYLLENGCWECASIETAFVLGFMPPKIYLPVNLTEQERKFVLIHERSHIARHDHWWKLLGYVVLAFHWFNPLVWVAYSLLCRDIEMACDECVVRSMDVSCRKAYSAALVSCSSIHHTIASPVAFGEVSVKARVKNVLNFKKPGFWIILAVVIAIVFVAVFLMTSPAPVFQEVEIPSLTYTDSGKAYRVSERFNPTITFEENTKDYISDYAIYHFDSKISEEDRDACVFYSDGILSRMGLGEKPEIIVIDGYDGAWVNEQYLYIGGDFASIDYGAKLIVLACGGYANYGAAYGYADYIAVEEGWKEVTTRETHLTNNAARDLNWLCFREEFVSGGEIEINQHTAIRFAREFIGENGEAAYLQIIRQSGDVDGVATFNAALSGWYASNGLEYSPTEVLYGIGGEYHDYLARSFYATFYMPKEWENKHFSALAKDENFLHESYGDVKRYYETAASQMAYIQELFGVQEDTSDIEVQFLTSGIGGTWAARNLIDLNYHAYIPTSYLDMMLFRHTEIRLHNGSYYEWLYRGLGEYMGQMVPSLYEDEVLLYSAEHGNRAYSTLEGDWFKFWQECVEGETDPDVYWRKRWDLMAYYYGTDFSGDGAGYISFTAYLIDQLGLQTLWDYFIVTERECPQIDFAKYRTEWEAYLEETYGQYPKFSEYEG